MEEQRQQEVPLLGMIDFRVDSTYKLQISIQQFLSKLPPAPCSSPLHIPTGPTMILTPEVAASARHIQLPAMTFRLQHSSILTTIVACHLPTLARGLLGHLQAFSVTL